MYRENKIRPFCGHAFLTNHDGLNNLGGGSPKEHSSNYIEIGPVVSDKKVFKFCFIVFLLAAMTTRVLLRFQFFEQLSVSTSQGSFL